MNTRERVEELERELQVEELTVSAFGGTFQVYPWLKGRIFHKMITGHETLQKRDLSLYLKQLGSLFYGLHNLFRRYDIWAFSSSMERRLVDGKYHDKLFDHIGNSCGKRILLIETRIFRFYPYRKIASRHAVSRSVFLLFEELYGRLFLRKVKVNDPVLLDKINLKVEGGVDHRLLIRKYLSQYRIMKLVLRLLPNPKLVFVSVGYTHFGYIRAFREKGIPVVEMQHGIISSNHHAYCYAKAFDALQFPNVILTNGEREKEVFGHDNAFPVERVIPVGSFIVDHYARRSFEHVREGIPRILFTLQDGQMGLKLLRFILDLKPQTRDKYELLVLPRRTTKEEYIQLLPEVEQLTFSGSDFYTTVIRCDLHCTVYSTTAVESLSLGVPNILVNIDGQSKEQLSMILGANPYTKTIANTNEFAQAAGELIGIPREVVAESNGYCIYPRYDENIRNVIKELIP
jgi:hypothetical protein